MKKIFVTILAFVFIVTSTGAMVHMHYCMGQLADWGIGHNESATCGQCGMENSEEDDNGCCKDEHQLVKNDSDQKITEPGFPFTHLPTLAMPVEYIDIPAANFSSVTEIEPVGNGPPRNRGVAVYIRNCVFLI